MKRRYQFNGDSEDMAFCDALVEEMVQTLGVPEQECTAHASVSIRFGKEVTPESMRLLEEWAGTREEGTHPYTRFLLDACVEEVRRPK